MHSGSRRDNDSRHIRLAVDRRGELTLDDDAHTSIVERDDRHSLDSSSPGLKHLGRRDRARAGGDASGLPRRAPDPAHPGCRVPAGGRPDCAFGSGVRQRRAHACDPDRAEGREGVPLARGAAHPDLDRASGGPGSATASHHSLVSRTASRSRMRVPCRRLSH